MPVTAAGLLAKRPAGVTHGELLEAYLLLAGDGQLESTVSEPTGRLAQVIKFLREEPTRRGWSDV